MAEEEKKKGRLATAVLAGSALALSSFSFGMPAFANNQDEPQDIEQVDEEPAEAAANETPGAAEETSSPSADEADEDESPAENDRSDQAQADDGEASPSSDDESDDTQSTPGVEDETAQSDTSDAGEQESSETRAKPFQATQVDANLSDHEGSAGDVITVDGSGFEPGTDVQLVLKAQANSDEFDFGTFQVDAQGTLVDAAFSVPDEALVGDYQVDVVQEEVLLSLGFAVISDDDDAERLVLMNISPGAGPTGTTVSLQGDDFSSDGQVDISMVPASGGETLTFDPAVADENGRFETEITVPDEAANDVYAVTAVDARTESTTSENFNVTEASLSIDPEEISAEDFRLDPADGGGVVHRVDGLEPGDEVDFNVGTTFSPAPQLSGSATAGEDGVATYTVHDTDDSDYIGVYNTTVTLADEDIQVASGTFEVTSEAPQVSLSDDPVVQGGSTLVSGYNFSANADVTINWDPAGEPLETQASETGELTYELLVPEEAELGTHDVVVTDENTGESVTIDLTVIESDDGAELDPEISLSVAEGYQGQSLTVTGAGFTPDGDVELVLGDQVIAATADDTGNISQRVGIPADFAAGTYDLTARDVATGQEASAELTVLEATAPALVISPEQITLDNFIRDSEDDNDQNGVVHTIVGLEEGDELVAVVDGPEGVETVEREETADEAGVIEFDIYGYDSVDPTRYLGTYDAEITIVDSDNEPLRGSFEVIEDDDDGGDDETPGDTTEISLSTDEAYPGDSVNVTGAGFTQGDEVIFNLNPDIGSATVDTNGAFDADVTIPEDLEPGEYELTARNEAADESATAALTILDPADQVTEPALTIDPEEIAVDEFIGDPEDGAGVTHTVQGVAPGSEISYVVSGPEGVNDFESSGVVDDDGTAEFVIYAPEIANPAVYLGDYNTVVTYENEDGQSDELQGSFAVVDGNGDHGSDGSGGSDAADDSGSSGHPVDLNGSDNLARTGASNVQLGLIAALLLAVGGAFVGYANRARLFPRKK